MQTANYAKAQRRFVMKALRTFLSVRKTIASHCAAIWQLKPFTPSKVLIAIATKKKRWPLKALQASIKSNYVKWSHRLQSDKSVLAAKLNLRWGCAWNVLHSWRLGRQNGWQHHSTAWKRSWNYGHDTLTTINVPYLHNLFQLTGGRTCVFYFGFIRVFLSTFHFVVCLIMPSNFHIKLLCGNNLLNQ